MYKAWKDGEASLTILGRQDGRYGRIGWKNPSDDSVHFWLPLRDTDKPSIIVKSGVSVVLLGKSKEEDTTVAPVGADLLSQWVAAFLERRYFEIPVGITIRVLRPVEIYDSGRGSYRAMHDTIKGQRHYLDKHSDVKGTVDVPGAKIWWWILKEDIVAGGKTWNNRGHFAAFASLYQARVQYQAVLLADHMTISGTLTIHPREKR